MHIIVYVQKFHSLKFAFTDLLTVSVTNICLSVVKL
jgi:hypothetical protein